MVTFLSVSLFQDSFSGFFGQENMWKLISTSKLTNANLVGEAD